MNPFSAEINEMLVTTYRSIGVIEEAMLKDMSSGQLSISEMHMIEAIGRDKEAGRIITDIAAELNVTMPSVTMAIKKLEKKGYVLKRRCSEDGRRVYVSLTKEGLRADIAHRYFHRQMVKTLVTKLSAYEKETLLNCLRELNTFFKSTARSIHERQSDLEEGTRG